MTKPVHPGVSSDVPKGLLHNSAAANRKFKDRKAYYLLLRDHALQKRKLARKADENVVEVPWVDVFGLEDTWGG